MRTLRAAIPAIVVALPLLVACGGDDGGSPTPPAADNGTDGAEDNGTDGAAAGGTLEFTAIDIDFVEKDVRADAGTIDVTMVNDGAIEHSWLVEDHEADLRLYVESEGDSDSGTIELDPGTYTYYCDIPGHEEAGMVGTLTVG